MILFGKVSHRDAWVSIGLPPQGLMSDQEDLLDIKQAARFLQVSETSLRRWTNAGHLACLRLGRKRERRFRRADLLAFMEDQPARKNSTG